MTTAGTNANRTLSLNAFFAASEARVDRWRSLNRVARSLIGTGVRPANDPKDLLAELAPLEDLCGYPGPRLMAQVQDRPVSAHVLETARAAEASQRVLVTRAESAVVELADGFEVVVNPDPEAGMGLSIALGVQALRPEVTGVFVVLGDMPFVEATAYAALAATDGDIVVPVYDGRQGHPVLFRRVCFEELSRLSGQAGARRLIDSGPYEVVTVALEGRGGLVDLDTPDDVSRTNRDV